MRQSPSFFMSFFFGTMTSADFLQFVVTTFFPSARPPRVSAATFASCICCIYALKLGQYWTSFWYGNSSVSGMPYIQFLVCQHIMNCVEVLPAGTLFSPHIRLPSDSTSRWTPLSSANSSYCQVCSGLSPPSDCSCQAHIRIASGRESLSEAFLCIFLTYAFAVFSFRIAFDII